MIDSLPLIMFFVTLIFLLSGYPVAFCLSGSSLLFAGIGLLTGHFDAAFLSALPERIFGIMNNQILIAVPLFVFMGIVLEKSKISEELLDTMALCFGGVRGGLGLSVCLVGGLLAASTGIVGATVVTMGLISLPTMLKRNYDPSLSTGIICASGTLGQIIPPSIVLIVLGDVISSAYQQAQLSMGNFSPSSVSVGDLFVGAIIPGSLLMLCYMIYILLIAWLKPSRVPAIPLKERQEISQKELIKRLVFVLTPPILLIIGVLGSILGGVATPTEAASVGSVGALILAMTKKKLSKKNLKEIMEKTTEISSMVFTILICAGIFSLVFRGYNGDELIRGFLHSAEGNTGTYFFIVMLVIFLLGFFLDFFEITFVVVPIVAPILLTMGFDPIWLGVMIALNLQTSFLTPPFGFSLFYLRGVAPKKISTRQIYRGVIPFIGIQLMIMLLIWFFPELSTWLPHKLQN